MATCCISTEIQQGAEYRQIYCQLLLTGAAVNMLAEVAAQLIQPLKES